MKTLTEKLQALQVAVRLRISAKIMVKGVESEQNSCRVLAVKEDQKFNLSGGRYLTEITAQELIDNEGYTYNHSQLTLEQLCEAVDNA